MKATPDHETPGTIEVSVSSEGLASLRLNRPDCLNSLNDTILEEMNAALDALASREDVKALIITGNGRAFSAGADLTLIREFTKDGGAPPGKVISNHMRDLFNPVMGKLIAFPKPVVTAINGIAAGGGVGLALCGDIVLASKSAALKVVQVSQLGIVPDLGANWLLQRAVGRVTALGMALTGEGLSAERARELGLVWQVVADESLLDTAMATARQLASAPGDAVIATRRLIDLGATTTFGESLELERAYQRDMCDLPAFEALVNRFLEGKS